MSTIQNTDNTGRVHISAEQVHQSADVSKWYKADKPLSKSARDLLEAYSGLDPEAVEPHARTVQAKAFALWPWPCLGQRFLELTTVSHPCYGEVVTRLQDNKSTYLDAGCCLGQDLRKLIYDGAPSSANLFGVDLYQGFFDIGYELFLDKDKLESTFVAANLTESSPSTLVPLMGKMDIISAQSLFHAFALDDQKMVATTFARLSRPQHGSIIFGRHVGNRQGIERQGLVDGTQTFAHNSETWTALWTEVGKLTDTEWSVQCWEEERPDRLKDQKWASDPDLMILLWVARQVKE